MQEKEHNLYIVITQSGSILSKTLKLVTRAPYNHVSLSLETDLHEMYSFGRLKPRNPIIGGFVMESPTTGTFARFYKTKAVVLSKPITEKQYRALSKHIETMYNRRQNYRYDVIGLFLAAFKIKYTRKNKYYCSEWVKQMLLRHKVAKKSQFEKITKPIHFMGLDGTKLIYTGALRDYSPAACC